MTAPTLGRTEAGPLSIDVERLLETRALLTASSGWGKSWALRRLLEQTHGRGAIQIVIDPEGEFASLRERFDFVIAGKGGDCPADPRAADLLARKVLELGMSAVLDLYELPSHDRVRFVRRFLEALIDAPKALWRPALVVIDEAHMFAPESGQAESRDAVRGLMTRGRKRGFAGVLATQRLAKLDKDACDAGNVLIGRYTLDVDVQRAAAQLGLPKARHVEIQRLGRGEFFAYGPALSDELVRVQVGDVATTHPKSGQRAAAPPAPRGTVLKVLEQLRDLPAEAAAETKNFADAMTLNRELERQVRALKLTKPGPDAADLATAEARGAQRATEHMQHHHARAIASLVASANAGRERAARALDQALAQIKLAADALREPIDVPEIQSLGATTIRRNIPTARSHPPFSTSARPIHQANRTLNRAQQQPSGSPAEGLMRPQQRILDELFRLEGWKIQPADKTQLALWCEVSPTSGGYFNNLGKLRSSGLIDYPAGGTVALTEEGRAIAREPEPMTEQQMREAIYARVGSAKAAILRALVAQHPESISKDELADAVEVSRTSGGYFNNLGALRTLGLIEYPSSGRVVALPVLFLS